MSQTQQIVIQFQHKLGHAQFDIDLVLPAQGITALFGRSGAGKTSIINAVSGLLTPDSGRINVGGQALFDSSNKTNVPIHQRRVGYVFQDARLFPHYSVKGNLCYGVKSFEQTHFDQIVDLLDIRPLLSRYPASLSGGEKQRVAIGRALLAKPNILLMDEPLASLDLPRKREVLPFLEQLAHSVKIPILYVSHSLHEVLHLANYLAIIDAGKVVASGPVAQIWSSQAMRPWQSFAEQSTLFEAQVLAQHEQYALTQVSLANSVSIWVQKLALEPKHPVRLQIRASDVSITRVRPEQTSIRNILPAIITQIERHGDDVNKESVSIQLQLGTECLLWATITPWALAELALKRGDEVFAQIKGVSVTQRDVATPALVRQH
ncbi:molybdenum ABC transporter ATP-binding protein ModC [Vibrio sp. SM6]|uniref:Molybdenum ABC transporter ATP-binding protein ModC n=1 Tax=Vibrio agarilyticus TaxID=2726741 RepID=A0A7X8TRA7_9VIBR|nr:molybdenum ABC transporter ATP-binding protein ModC [Vibrio agarilyticus]NLS13335.1 molybdenum ABC transporter ATP-binding protein ModC [Vibrio agarilyticus]